MYVNKLKKALTVPDSFSILFWKHLKNGTYAEIV